MDILPPSWSEGQTGNATCCHSAPRTPWRPTLTPIIFISSGCDSALPVPSVTEVWLDDYTLAGLPTLQRHFSNLYFNLPIHLVLVPSYVLTCRSPNEETVWRWLTEQTHNKHQEYNCAVLTTFILTMHVYVIATLLTLWREGSGGTKSVYQLVGVPGFNCQ